MFAEGVGSETVCVEKVGATTQSISVMVTGRKCVWAYDVWGCVEVCEGGALFSSCMHTIFCIGY